jgi:diguanylate cyclase (GGDEF)-like protein
LLGCNRAQNLTDVVLPMTSSLRSPRSLGSQVPPPDVYISLVDSLFSDWRSLLIGSVAATMTAIITAWRTGELLLYGCAAAIALVALVRLLQMRSYARHRGTLVASAAYRWEKRYVIGAAAHVALLGLFCFIALTRTSDPFVQLFAFSLTLAYLIGISGRNFASNLLVDSQIVCAGIPMALALLVAGGPYFLIFVFVLLPLFLAIKLISARLKNTLLDAVISARDVKLLAARFNTALDNMPHGLAMFDASQQLVVANRRLVELLRLPLQAEDRNRTARQLLLECAEAGTISNADASRLADDFDDRLSGRILGDLDMETRDRRSLAVSFEPMENGGSVVLVEDVTERKQAEARIRQLARYDPLTGLPNRHLLHEHMNHPPEAVGQSRQLGALLFIDLDQFKQVNDTLGHPFGDRLLCAVSDRLRTLVSALEFVARFGGDEFVVLLPAPRGEDDAAVMAKRIVDALAEPYNIDHHRIVIGCSIGIAMGSQGVADADRLLKNADMALYRAKADGRGGWRFFEPEMDIRAQARRSLELELRNALEQSALRVYYQPLFNLKTKRFSTCEALLRWNHPERGWVSPAEFIPIAEETGLIVEIGNWVLREACAECAKWPSDVRVAVNLSPVQFRRGGVINAVRDALALSGLAPHRLEVEITESVLLQDNPFTRMALQQLRDMGVRIALDDFGTGYSSLSYLQKFHLQKVKLDRSFLQGIGTSPRSLILLRGIARLSSELGMLIAVEGIETEEQMALVAAVPNIDEAQGFLFSRAVPGQELRKLLLGEAQIVRVA